MAGLPWIKVYTDLPRDPRSLHLADLLSDARAWTYVLEMRLYFAEHAPTGTVSGPGAVATVERSAGWTGERGALIEAMRDAGFVRATELPTGGIHVVDVDNEHQPDNAWPRRVRHKPEAMTWARNRPGCPLPPPDGMEPSDEEPFVLRLTTPEEQAAYRAEEEARMAPIRAARAEQARLRARRWVYFMQERENPSAPIKIGISRDVERRRNELQRTERVILSCLASFEGTIKDEQAMHVRFAAHRLHGEWFSPAPELLSHIAALNGVKS